MGSRSRLRVFFNAGSLMPPFILVSRSSEPDGPRDSEMITSALSKPVDAIFYPESDGLPMAENTLQLNWIIALVTNLRALFRGNANVFVAGDQFWYPVEGEPEIRQAPDVYVIFGRPKRERPSYKQWEEGGIPMTVVWEILSPANTFREMADKFTFYEDYGVEEYYIYDPDNNWLQGYIRRGEVLIRQRAMNGFVSPRLGIRFDLSGPELVVRYPDGQPFLSFEELTVERQLAVQRAEKAEQEAKQLQQRAARTAELTRKIMRQEATPEEIHELQSLLEAPERGG
jgi:Uma2 family endonuclease